MAAAKLLVPRALLADGRRPEEVHSKAGRSNLGKASAVLYDGNGDAREARLVLDEPDWSVQVTCALRISESSADARSIRSRSDRVDMHESGTE